MRPTAATQPPISRVVFLMICALVAGCTENAQQEEESNLRLLSVFYGQYRAEHRGLVPTNEQDFKAYITAKGTNAPAESGGVNVEELFVSGRDGKPFVIRYRSDKSWPLPEINIYEQEGRGGTRHVATVGGGYDEMSEEEFLAEKTAPVARK